MDDKISPVNATPASIEKAAPAVPVVAVKPTTPVSTASTSGKPATPSNSATPTDVAPAQIEYADFAKLAFRVGVILTAERIEGATKLLKLTVEVGGEKRTLGAGIAESYAPEELVGRKVIVLTNLKPRVIRGVESQGMVLAADNGDKAVLLTVDAPSGAKIK